MYVKRYKRNCGRADCPTCFEAWAAKEAHSVERRLAHAKVRPIHVILSPPNPLVVNTTKRKVPTTMCLDQKKDYLRARSVAYENLKAVGCLGGVVMFHAFRWRCDLCGKDDEACWCDTKRGFWYWSPHWHSITYGWVRRTAENFERGGWVVKNVGLRKSLYATVQYLLSHAGVWQAGILPNAKSKVCSITWFGTLSYNKLHVVDELPKETCPMCGAELVLLRWVGQGDPPLVTLDMPDGVIPYDSLCWVRDGFEPGEGRGYGAE